MYRTSLGLLTDLYQLTMALSYWKAGVADREAAFSLTFRRNPFQGGFTVACGLEHVIDWIRRFQFDHSDLSYLATLNGNDGERLFPAAFLEYLRGMRFSFDLSAVPEGTVVFPHEPIARVRGPIIECQMLETAILNITNFQTLIATKAARVCLAAQGDPVLEFGLRRAQGIDGALAASRAAYVGGCSATSNVLAGKLFDIPVRGTHAHSWVMCFDSELEAFKEYARAMPNNCVFLVDTYHTLEGVQNAVRIGKWLRENNHRLAGIRLDSGDLAYLSVEARRILDEEGFDDTPIIASNDLDEHLIESLKRQGAMIAIWGVGTRLATAFDEPALGGVYKLTAIRKPGTPWQMRVKLSEQKSKISTPGVLQVRRYYTSRGFLADAIYEEHESLAGGCTIVDPLDATRRKRISADIASEDLLVPIIRAGRPVYESPKLYEIRQRVRQQLSQLHPTMQRFVNPHEYPVGLDVRLHDKKEALILATRGLLS
ncbi:MAG: nicotinate phosphoribosyltransferase [Phycisphaerales bacterium]|nr:nicotinate phosphoribosyltransferase [Phycisphaerales bacterium]